MKTVVIKHHFSEESLKKLFFNMKKALHLGTGHEELMETNNGNQEYKEYVENYRKMTRWQTL